MLVIKPVGNKVLVKSCDEEQNSSFGIIIPETVDKETKTKGMIVAVGSGDQIEKNELKIGDIVIFEKWGGEEVDINEEESAEYRMLDVKNILAIIS